MNKDVVRERQRKGIKTNINDTKIEQIIAM
jgi:hypothetical protein